MRTRWTMLGLAAAAAAVFTSQGLTAREQGTMSGSMHEQMSMPAPPKTNAEKIANAMTAAPAAVSKNATILDWPAKDGDAPTVLRAGTNGWSCFPDMPQSQGNDPACMDGPWLKWAEAYMSKKAPDVGHVGIAYMLAPGGSYGSNTDPYAMTETKDNHWAHHHPHMMIVVPDVKSLEGMSTDPNNGGPYVMYPGTPYAHIMAPGK